MIYKQEQPTMSKQDQPKAICPESIKNIIDKYLKLECEAVPGVESLQWYITEESKRDCAEQIALELGRKESE